MTTAADDRPDAGHGPAWRFIRHYLEMVAAMLAGMAALGVLQLAVEVPGGTGVELVEMAVWMTVPMVAWMRFRGHAWRPCAEMALAMFVPTAGALTLLGAGVVTDADTLVMLDHTVMFPAMLVAMLLRRDEYTGHDHAVEPAQSPADQPEAGREPVEHPVEAVLEVRVHGLLGVGDTFGAGSA